MLPWSRCDFVTVLGDGLKMPVETLGSSLCGSLVSPGPGGAGGEEGLRIVGYTSWTELSEEG